MRPGARRPATPPGTPRSGWKNRSPCGPSAACSACTASSAWLTRKRSKNCSKKSAANQQEVTDQLGYQVRKAVEVLIQSLDRADQDHGRELLRGVSEAELYEAALTVMMRLVFLFCAEERELLLAGRSLYDQHYARLHDPGATAGHRRPVRRGSPRTPPRCLVSPADVVPGRLRRRLARQLQAPGLRRSAVRPRPLPVPRRPQAGNRPGGTPRPRRCRSTTAPSCTCSKPCNCCK